MLAPFLNNFLGLFRSIRLTYFFFFKDFWQNYPKSIDVSNGDFHLKILPEINKQEFNFQEDEIHRLGFWFDESDYLVKMGMSLSSTFLIDLSNLYNNLNDFKKKYFNDKSYIDIYTTCFLKKTDEKRKIKGYMGFKEYEYPIFLSFNEIYNEN